ncbi:hypothetical protein BH09SUM1_BH09SUM1_16440 [soil metagenome]
MRAILLSLTLAIFLTGCDDDQVFYTIPAKEKIAEPPDNPTIQQQQAAAPDMGSSDSGLPAPEHRKFGGEFQEKTNPVTLKGVTLQIPARYQSEPAASSMRIAQYIVPQSGAGGQGELTIFYFGAGQGGSAADNAGRWLRQFKREGDVSPLTGFATDAVNGLNVTRLTLEGTWTAPAMGPNAPAQPPKPDWAMDAFVIEGGPEGSLFLRLTGPVALLKSEAPVMEALAASVKSDSAPMQTPPPRELHPLDTNVGTVPDNPRLASTPAATPVLPGSNIGLDWKVPEGWQPIPTSSPLRAAEFHKPGENGKNLEAIVFHFGDAGGGTAEDNIRRWIGQVSQPDGSSSDAVAKNKTWKSRGLTITRVDVSGSYKQTAMGPNAPASTPQENYTLVGAVVEGGPGGSIYVRITGPQDLIKSEADHIDEFLTSIEASKNGTR